MKDPQPNNDLIKAALYYEQQGYSVIPVQSNKRPRIKWKSYQKRRADETQIRKWLTKWPDAGVPDSHHRDH
jgi:hypothetical protein